MARLVQAAVKNPKLLGAFVGAVLGLIVGLIVDILVFHGLSLERVLAIGLVVGGALGWWQYKRIAARAAKFLLGRLSPL
jgi:hypothetical protein